jgi:hypothetical protein
VSSANQATIERYMEGFRRTDRAGILTCLTDDVEWYIPGMFHGTVLDLVFYDLFEMRRGLIRRLTSYLMELRRS